MTSPEPLDREDEPFDEGDPWVDDGDDDAPSFAEGLGALGQLAAAVIVVAILLAVFLGGSALLRRIFG